MIDYNGPQATSGGTGLYDYYNVNSAVDQNDWLNAGVKLPPLSMGWENQQQQLPFGGQVNVNDIGAGNGGLFDNWSMGDSKDLIGGMGGLYSMYQGHQLMGLAKDDLSNRKRALDYNISSDKAFKSGVQSSFA